MSTEAVQMTKPEETKLKIQVVPTLLTNDPENGYSASEVIRRPEGEKMQTRAILYNFSGHRIPDHVFTWLKDNGYKHFVPFSTPVHIDFDRPVEVQVEEILDEFAEKVNNIGQRPFQVGGHKFIMLPGHEVAADLINTAVESLLRVPPDLMVIKYDAASQEYILSQVVKKKGWKGFWRSKKRKQYCTPKDVAVEL